MPKAATAPSSEQANGPALKAVRALLTAERANAHRALPPNDASWRFLLALYEAELTGRPLTPAEAADAAAVPPGDAPAMAAHFEAEDLVVRGEAGTLRLTEEACESLALWVYALHPLPAFNPYRVAAGVPRPKPPREPPA